MNQLLRSALELAENGFYVFPLVPGGKKPVIEDFPNKASRDVDQIKMWWSKNPNYNVGISTSKFNGDGEFIVAVDVDNKDEKHGDQELLKLINEGLVLGKTFEQITPTGGRHLIYKTREPVRNSAGLLANGVDIRGVGGYLVGSGSVINGKNYYSFDVEVADASESLVSRCKRSHDKKPVAIKVDVDQPRAIERAKHYLKNEAPVAIQGDQGDQTTFQVAAHIKDMGLTPQNALDLMTNYWNERCLPPWEDFDLQLKVENAYKYGHDFAGAKAPEVIFTEVPTGDKLHPILELNKEYAFVTLSGRAFVLHETTDIDGLFRVYYLTVQAFQQRMLPQTIIFNDKKHQLADLWLRSPDRRTYTGVCFMPGQESPKDYYNLWHGFSFEPSENVSAKAKRAVEMLLDHIRENICAGEEDLFKWLITFFAHLIQKPWEKPMVATVFKGGKGVGKNFFIEQIGELLNGHYVLASDARYLVSNFNGHFENCLLFVLDEAFWSGDKRAEGRLKDLITGKAHQIERKGAESYKVKNCTRVAIIGNEDWLVPASNDERRFAVFSVGNKRKKDHAFFEAIKTGMLDGGYQYLLKYLSEYDCSEVNLNEAPDTEGLAEQKISSLSPFYEWWFECLKAGKIISSDFAEGWELDVERERFRNAYRRFVKERNLRLWGETDTAIGKLLKKCLPSVQSGKRQADGIRANTYHLPILEVARAQWDAFIGFKVNWDA